MAPNGDEAAGLFSGGLFLLRHSTRTSVASSLPLRGLMAVS
jgi:hypothetical protein